MKKFLFLLLLLPTFAFAQKVIKHTVVAKESYSSIGRLYNINGRELADYNNLDYTVGLSIGQILKVPVKDNTTIPTPTPVAKTPVQQTNQPIYHTLKQGESLYQLSRTYAPSTVDNIRKWNNLTSDNLILGDRLIVGYSKENVTRKTEIEVEDTPSPLPKVKADSEVKAGELSDLQAKAKALEIEQKRLEDEVERVKKQQKELEEKEKADKKAEQERMRKEAKQTAKVKLSTGDGAGFFKKDFTGEIGASSEGKSGVFKSTSGWEDEKYYALFDGARSGTILKVTNNETGKSVFVKVLDIIPRLNENKSMIIRLSNATASALGANEADFTCTVQY